MVRKCSYIPVFVFMICIAAACGAEEAETAGDRAGASPEPGLLREWIRQQEPQSIDSGLKRTDQRAGRDAAEFSREGTKSPVHGEMTQSQAFELFLDNELPVFFSVAEGEACLYYDDYCDGGFVEEEEYEISRLDLDNDGEEELVIDSMGHYGTAVIDFRDGRLCFLAQGEGTAGICSYIFIPAGSKPGAAPDEFAESLSDAAGTSTEEEAWIVHRDTSHAGRQMFWFEKYNGEGEVVDQFTLFAEYWEEPEDRYTEDSDFTYRDEKITMREYEELRMLLLGW